ncbi:hypothetical protein Tco_1122043 [Tanacetum coccineum]|uniref:Uncharacterized protein n=1 Tax=Tanacetum coccineum TaxID=301880 RepID=A0ABQ5J2D8_9ASTR
MFQRAKVDWLNDEDKNSAFFHKVIKGRVDRSRVDEFEYWKLRLSGESGPYSIFKIMHQNALDMIIEVSNNEVKDAMFSIDDNKVPGPEGSILINRGLIPAILTSLPPQLLEEATKLVNLQRIPPGV